MVQQFSGAFFGSGTAVVQWVFATELDGNLKTRVRKRKKIPKMKTNKF